MIDIDHDTLEEFMRKYKENLITKEYKVYKDLKEKNYFVTLGFKYGADFLVYREDPNFIHSEFILNVYESEAEVSIKELIYGERIGVTTKKKFIAAVVQEKIVGDKIFCDSEEEEKVFNIEYLNFEWLNI